MSKFNRPGKSRTTTGGSIRGKISHPIPLQDDEFPIRTPGTGIATPVGSVDFGRGLRSRSNTTELDGQPGLAITTFDDQAVGTYTAQVIAQPVPEEKTRRSKVTSSERNSAASGLSASGKPQRKKSTLRSVFGRIFGKKKSSISSIQEKPDTREQHRSDPSAFTRSPKGVGNQRSASLPINEFNRALRSHSVVLEDFPRISQGSTRNTNRESQQSQQTDVQTRPRGATTPSKWGQHRVTGGDWTGLTPRPASSHPRGSKIEVEGDNDAPIGTAVSSGSHPNRRSRSMGSLRQAAGMSVLPRRRSDEIKYWRESYDPTLLSPLSSVKPDEEPTQGIILADESENKENEDPREQEEQPQPFNFGLLGELAGMKITQAAGLEERVGRIEERILNIETAIFQWQRQQPIHFQDPPKRSSLRGSSLIRSQEEESSVPRHRDTQPRQPLLDTTPQGRENRSSSYSSSHLSSTSNHDATLHRTELPPSLKSTAQDFSRPLSTTTTIRGLSISPTSQKLQDVTFTAEHYTSLTNMVLAERTRRIELEAIVKSLQQQLQQMMVLQRSRYPTPEADSLPDHLKRSVNSYTSAPKDSEFENESSDDESQDRERYEQEIYQTPMEERGHFGDDSGDDGIFGEVVNGEQRRAPRTLSLSQITMGKGMQQAINF